MSKAKYSPGTIVRTALEKYLVDEDIYQVMKDTEKVELKLKAIAFSLKSVLAYYGKNNIETKIEDNSIKFNIGGSQIYILDNIELKKLNVPLINKRTNEVSVDIAQRLWINLCFHYGNIMNITDSIGQGQMLGKKNSIQTALAV